MDTTPGSKKGMGYRHRVKGQPLRGIGTYFLYSSEEDSLGEHMDEVVRMEEGREGKSTQAR